MRPGGYHIRFCIHLLTNFSSINAIFVLPTKPEASTTYFNNMNFHMVFISQ